MATLQILCPNGRRQNVKITPNTKLLQVLEDVCQKQKFLPVEDYQLIQGRKTLDLTLSVRYSNLPNNAKLELVKAEQSRAESDVMIALQLESGERLQHSFSPGTSLWSLLQHWEQQADGEVKYKDRLTHVDTSQSPPVHPVCIYMREEVTGSYALQETMLRTLGLTGGKAVIRLLHRSVEDQTLDEIKAKIDKEKLRKSRLGGKQGSQTTQSSLSPQTISGTSVATGASPSVQRSISIEANVQNVQSGNDPKVEVKGDNTTISLNINLNIQNDNNKALACDAASASGNEAEQSQNEAKQSNEAKREEPVTKIGRMEESCDQGEPMEVEHSGERDVMETEESVSSSSEGTKPATDRSSERAQAVDSLRNIPGLQVITPDDFHDLPPDQQVIARRLAQSLLANMASQGMIPGQALPAPSAPERKKQKQSSQFVDFKFPEATKGKQLYNNDLGSARRDDFKPCERKTVVFNIEENRQTPSSSTSESVEDLPEEFFDLTERDMRSLMAERQKRLLEMQDQPLMTSSMRRAKLEEDYGKYNRVIIRVQFHDKLVLQGIFRPRETVFSLQKFVKEHLEDKSLPFYLYTAPPKLVLKDQSQTLLEARLVPASLVYFGCEQHRDHYLSEAVLSEQSAKLTADELVAECLGSVSEDQLASSDQPSYSGKGKKPANSRSGERAGGSSIPSPSASSLPGPSTGRLHGPSTGGRTGADNKVPKWFKVGKK